jgi:hypothetical protein
MRHKTQKVKADGAAIISAISNWILFCDSSDLILPSLLASMHRAVAKLAV